MTQLGFLGRWEGGVDVDVKVRVFDSPDRDFGVAFSPSHYVKSEIGIGVIGLEWKATLLAMHIALDVEIIDLWDPRRR